VCLYIITKITKQTEPDLWPCLSISYNMVHEQWSGTIVPLTACLPIDMFLLMQYFVDISASSSRRKMFGSTMCPAHMYITV